jgi:hypothetical protein
MVWSSAKVSIQTLIVPGAYTELFVHQLPARE